MSDNMDGKWDGYQNITLTAPMTVKIPRMLHILNHWIMMGKMTLDEEEKKITITYHIQVDTADNNARDYCITATRNWDLSGGPYDTWYVSAKADSSRRMPHRKDFNDRTAALEERLDEASKWIEEHIRDFALGSLTYKDFNYE